MRVAIRSWWGERSERERILLAALGAVAAVALVLLLIVRPLQAARADALADIRTYETLSARLRAAGPGIGRTPYGDGSLSAAVTGSAATAGLTVQRLDPEGGQTRVVIADASYDAVVAWLAELDRGGVRIEEVRIERRPAAGMVGAQVLVGR